MHAIDPRASHLLRAFQGVANNPETTIWGPYRCFDGLFLSLLASGQTSEGIRLLEETLDMIDANLADEESGKGDKWHLGDFAIHAVWRAGVVDGQGYDV